MKKIFYFTHVPWTWIKQRPHFIAEKLLKYYVVDVYCFFNFKSSVSMVKNNSKIEITRIPRLPFSRFYIVKRINEFFSKLFLIKKIQNYDYIYVPTPNFYFLLKEKIGDNQKIIYDCMDNYSSMQKDKKIQKKIEEQEKELLKKSDLVLFSSDHLKNTLFERYNLNKEEINATVVNNGINIYVGNEIKQKIKFFNNNKMKKITYIGTIGEWFDIKLLQESLKIFSNIEYHLFGPLEIELPKNCNRIIYHGSIEHEEVNHVMQESDALIMPFLVNDIVLSVNPVKAYEYISSKKPVLMIRYPETKKFEDYIFLYESKEEYYQYLNKLELDILHLKETKISVEEYLVNNTWEARAKQIMGEIEKIV